MFGKVLKKFGARSPISTVPCTWLLICVRAISLILSFFSVMITKAMTQSNANSPAIPPPIHMAYRLDVFKIQALIKCKPPGNWSQIREQQ